MWGRGFGCDVPGPVLTALDGQDELTWSACGRDMPRLGGFLRKLALLLLPEFSNFGVAAVTEPLFIANWLAQDTVFEWRTICDDGKPVRASNGSIVPVDGDLALA